MVHTHRFGAIGCANRTAEATLISRRPDRPSECPCPARRSHLNGPLSNVPADAAPAVPLLPICTASADHSLYTHRPRCRAVRSTAGLLTCESLESIFCTRTGPAVDRAAVVRSTAGLLTCESLGSRVCTRTRPAVDRAAAVRSTAGLPTCKSLGSIWPSPHVCRRGKIDDEPHHAFTSLQRQIPAV